MSEKRSAEKLAGYRVDRGKGGFKGNPHDRKGSGRPELLYPPKASGKANEQAVRQADRAGAGIPDGRSLDFRG